MDIIKGAPTPGMSYDPNDPVYWDANALHQELRRAFEICNGCRLCFNLCPSFPEMFNAFDRQTGEHAELTAEEIDRVLAGCFQCKICFVKCPYTPDDKHEFRLDFPRLLLRAHAVRQKKRGIKLRDRLLSRPEMLGRMAKLTPGIANWANRQPLLRSAMQAGLGIHKDKLLPEFHGESFEDWYRKQPPSAGDPTKAVLFSTCFINYNHPGLGKDLMEVFSRNGIALGLPKQNCCGMPAMEAGDIELAKRLARQNVEALLPYVREGKKVVAVNPTCSYMMRKEYGDLVGTAEARQVAAAAMDPCEFLFQLKQEGKLNRDFRSTPELVAYHLPCHLRAQNIGFRSRDLMRLIPGTTVKMVEQCCGHDGTWAMRKEFFPLSLLTGKKAFDQMQAVKANVMATDCPLAAIHFQQAIGQRPIHPIQVLARAYRADGFPKAINPPEEKK
jgi:glycerol-3-phosphate dehydrogenase subunit C